MSLNYTDGGGRRRGTRVRVLQPVSGSVCLSESQVHLDRGLLSVSLGTFVTAMLAATAKLYTMLSSIVSVGLRKDRCSAESLSAICPCNCLCYLQSLSPIQPSLKLLPLQFPLYCCLFFVGLIWVRGYTHKNMVVFICWLNSTTVHGKQVFESRKLECWPRLTRSAWILVKCSQIVLLVGNNSPWSILIHLDRFHKHRLGKLMWEGKKKASVHSQQQDAVFWELANLSALWTFQMNL